MNRITTLAVDTSKLSSSVYTGNGEFLENIVVKYKESCWRRRFHVLPSRSYVLLFQLTAAMSASMAFPAIGPRHSVHLNKSKLLSWGIFSAAALAIPP